MAEHGTVILTMWENTYGRPVETPGLPNGYEGISGLSPFTPDSPAAVAEFVDRIGRYGHVAITDSRVDRSWNHHLAGIGGGHNDADWCESRFQAGSHAVWLENDPLSRRFNNPVEVIVRRAAKGDQ